MSPATTFIAVLPTPGQDPDVATPERVQAQSVGGREALALAARVADAGPLSFDKNEREAPLPCRGWHWSISHDDTWVAGALARAPVGVDLERVVLRRAALRAAVIDEAEAEFLGAVDALAFTRIWTAKEAVLKAAGVGLGQLSRCRLAGPLQGDRARMSFEGRQLDVVQRVWENHVISVYPGGAEVQLRWVLPGDAP